MPAVSSSLNTELRVAERLAPSGPHVQSTLQVSPGGRLTLTSRASLLPESGGFVGVVALLYGAGRTPEWLWNSIPTAYGIEPAVGDCAQVSITATHDLDTEILAAARYVAIKQFACPSRDAWSDIKAWLDAAQSPTHGFEAVRHTAWELAMTAPARSTQGGPAAPGTEPVTDCLDERIDD